MGELMDHSAGYFLRRSVFYIIGVYLDLRKQIRITDYGLRLSVRRSIYLSKFDRDRTIGDHISAFPCYLNQAIQQCLQIAFRREKGGACPEPLRLHIADYALHFLTVYNAIQIAAHLIFGAGLKMKSILW